MSDPDDGLHVVDVPASTGCVLGICVFLTGVLLGALAMGVWLR